MVTQLTEAATPAASDVLPTDVIDRMVKRLGHPRLNRGDLAALRRMDPERPHEPAFILLMLDAGAPEHWTDDVDQARYWALVAYAMAMMVPHHHEKDAHVGLALFKARITEARVARLLASRGLQFRKQIVRLARQLTQKAERVNWRELGLLILAERRDVRTLDKLRLSVARDYYKAQFKARNAPSKDAS